MSRVRLQLRDVVRAGACGAAVLLAAACDRPAPPSADPASKPATSGAWLEDVAAARGLAFRYESGHRTEYWMPEIIGGGAALFDFDGDGDLDAYLVQGGRLDTAREQQPTNRLFKNRGDGSFEDVTAGSGTDDRGYGMGVACGDADGDGDVDLYVTNYGPDVLLRNDGDGHFTDVTQAAGMTESRWSTSAAFVDHDRDGDLDLFVAHYISWSRAAEIECLNAVGQRDYCKPQNYKASARDTLYRNNGDGTFTDVSEDAGLGSSLGNGLGVTCGDFDADGWIDVFVANDGTPDQLWINQGNGKFVDGAMLAGCAVDDEGYPKAGMGVTSADIDDDGDLDVLVANLSGQSDSLFINEGRGFVDATARLGLAGATRPYTRFGCGFVDFDQDGRLDLYEANGRVERPTDPPSPDPYAEPSLLFRGTADGKFEEVAPGGVHGGTASPLVRTSRGAAFGDVDGDGAIDVLVVNRDADATLLRNVAPNRGHWLLLRVLDARGSDALGAAVSITAGGRTMRRDVRAAYSYCSSSDPRVHVGLGAAARADDVTVRWTDGTSESFGAQDADRVVMLRRGAGQPKAAAGVGAGGAK